MLGLALQGPSVSAGLHMLAAGAAKPPGAPEVAFPEAIVPLARASSGKIYNISYNSTKLLKTANFSSVIFFFFSQRSNGATSTA